MEEEKDAGLPRFLGGRPRFRTNSSPPLSVSVSSPSPPLLLPECERPKVGLVEGSVRGSFGLPLPLFLSLASG